MPRRATPLECSADDKAALLAIRKNRTEDTRVIERAKIVLARLNGKEVQQVARDMNVSIPTVTMWCKRFVLKGVAGLRDDPRSGKPARYDSTFRDSVLGLLVHPPPSGMARWDGRAIAEKLGASVDAVWRVLRRERIYLKRRRCWRIGTDAGFVSKKTEVLALYLNPPLNALIIGAAELPGFEAFEESSSFVETESGDVARSLKRARRRQGALTLATAIEAGPGQGRGPLTERQRWNDFQAFLGDVIAKQSKAFEIHALIDCGSRDREWLKASEQRIACHFTSSSAHWLSLIQIVFSLLHMGNPKEDDKADKGLRDAIEAFIRHHHDRSRSFLWRKGEIHYDEAEIQ